MKEADATPGVTILVADPDQGKSRVALVLINPPCLEDTGHQEEEEEAMMMMTATAPEEVTTTLGKTSLTTLTHWDHHQAVEEAVAEVEAEGAAEEADLDQRMVIGILYLTELVC